MITNLLVIIVVIMININYNNISSRYDQNNQSNCKKKIFLFCILKVVNAEKQKWEKYDFSDLIGSCIAQYSTHDLAFSINFSLIGAS